MSPAVLVFGFDDIKLSVGLFGQGTYAGEQKPAKKAKLSAEDKERAKLAKQRATEFKKTAGEYMKDGAYLRSCQGRLVETCKHASSHCDHIF